MQALDSRLDTLRHQMAHPPEAGEIARLTAECAELDGAARDIGVRVDDLVREQRRAEADVEQVKTRRTRDQQRLDSGQVGNPKDLQRLQHELVSLDRRISDLEDLELEVMEQLETAQGEVAGLREKISTHQTRLAVLTSARDARLEQVKAEATTVARERDAMVLDLPEDLLALYDKLREQKGGVGAALLRARRCEGCSLELNRSDLAGIAKQSFDDVVRCEECSRILVRTAESGL